jgi:hypothetical protein
MNLIFGPNFDFIGSKRQQLCQINQSYLEAISKLDNSVQDPWIHGLMMLGLISGYMTQLTHVAFAMQMPGTFGQPESTIRPIVISLNRDSISQDDVRRLVDKINRP